jgi:hypothetical protein
MISRVRGGNLSGIAHAKERIGGGQKALLLNLGDELCSDVTHHSASYFTSRLIASSPKKALEDCR